MNTDRLIEEKLRICLNGDRLPFNTDLAQARLSLQHKLDNSAANGRSSQKASPILKWAASVAAILALCFAGYQLAEVSFPESASVAMITLPDGSTVQLAPQSSGSYNTLGWLVSRKVYLDHGRGFFEVKKGERFTVISPKGRVAVLGTSFDVLADAVVYRVSCKTGKVAVTGFEGSESFTLTPGQYVDFDAETWYQGDYAPAMVDAWVSGSYNFENTRISTVFAELARAFGYAIDSNAVAESQLYSGSFKTSQNLDDILRIVCKPSDLNYTIDETRKLITITKN